ncbi:putative RNA methyltransferase [Marinactinospora thermotolerans]
MPAPVLDALACPHCGAGLAPEGGALRCVSAHSFDVAREGYVNLLTGHRSAGTGDTAEMVRARVEFQQAGHYAPLADRIAAIASGAGGDEGVVVDIGAGTGYYLAAVLERRPRAVGLALDVSKFALRRAAKSHPRAGAAGCDAWRGLPVRSGSASLLLNVFAPRDGAEFRRVLRPDGRLVVVTPTARHLAEVVGALGLVTVDARKEERLEGALAGSFLPMERDELDTTLELSHEAATTLVEMGPSARHLPPGELRRRVAALPEPVTTTASFRISLYRPAPQAG